MNYFNLNTSHFSHISLSTPSFLGVIEKPISGAASGGVSGFFKGMYGGAKGLVLKPVTGVLDGVSKIAEGASNTFVKDI